MVKKERGHLFKTHAIWKNGSLLPQSPPPSEHPENNPATLFQTNRRLHWEAFLSFKKYCPLREPQAATARSFMQLSSFPLQASPCSLGAQPQHPPGPLPPLLGAGPAALPCCFQGLLVHSCCSSRSSSPQKIRRHFSLPSV